MKLQYPVNFHTVLEYFVDKVCFGKTIREFNKFRISYRETCLRIVSRKEKSILLFFGTFILTKKRLLFFPSINMSTIELSEKDILNQCHLNHLSLENNLRDWHITVDEKSQNPKKKLNTYKTKIVGNNISLWFVMCLSSHTHMVKLPKELETKLICHTYKDLRHRLGTIRKSYN